jgi:hypothetical protein
MPQIIKTEKTAVQFEKETEYRLKAICVLSLAIGFMQRTAVHVGYQIAGLSQTLTKVAREGESQHSASAPSASFSPPLSRLWMGTPFARNVIQGIGPMPLPKG